MGKQPGRAGAIRVAWGGAVAVTRSGRRWVAVAAVAAVLLAFAYWRLAMPNWQARAVTSVAGSSESTVLDVTVAHEDCGTGDPRVNVSEAAEVVALSAEYDEGRSGCNDIGQSTTISVELDQPLGNRTVEVRTLGRGVDSQGRGSARGFRAVGVRPEGP